MLGGVVGGGGCGSSKRRHSTQSLSLLYRPSKPDIDLIRDHTMRRGSTTCGTAAPAASTGPSAGSFLGLRRHSEIVVSPTLSTSPVCGGAPGGRQVRLSIDSGRVVQEFHFVKRGFFKSADQIYNKVFGGGPASGGGSGSGSSSMSTADAYAQHYGGSTRSRSKSFNALGGVPLTQSGASASSPGGGVGVGGGVVADFSSLGQAIESHLRNQLRSYYGGSTRSRSKSFNALGGVPLTQSGASASSPGGGVGVGGGVVADFSSLGQAIESHLRNQLRRATFSNIADGNQGGVAGSSSSSLQPTNQRPRSHSTCVVSFPTIIVTQEPQSSGSGHHMQQPTQSLVRTEYENKTQVILEETPSPSNNHSSSTGPTSSSGGVTTLCGLVREILSRTFSVGVGFIRGGGGGGGHHQQQSNSSSSNNNNKRFFF